MSLLRVDVESGRVRAAFGSLRRRLADISSGWQRVGARMEAAAEPLVPVETGRLVDSLKAQAKPGGVELASDVVYAGVQDRGWPGHGIAGHHFMQAAEDAARGRAVVEELAPEIQNVIDRVGLG